MKYILVFLLLALGKTSYGQHLSGKWTGSLPQDDKTHPFTMETDLVQKGAEISGTSTYVYASDCYVTISFLGTIKGDQVKIREQKVITSTPCSLWCIKTMTGRLRIDSLNNKLIIEGEWESSRLFNGTSYIQGPCAPGSFEISKSLPAVRKEVVVIKAVANPPVKSKPLKEEAIIVKPVIFKDNRRLVIKEKTISTSSEVLRAEIYDADQNDGDSVSVILNNVLILKKTGLTKEHKKSFTIHLIKGQNTMVLFANNIGTQGLNTAGLKIYDGKVLLRTIELESGPNHSEGINIIYK